MPNHQIPDDAVSPAAISAVRAAIRGYIRTTPILEVDAGELGLEGFRIVFKLELMQHAGSFKPRGAFAGLLGAQQPKAGVAAASGGNHGLAVAYAASVLGIKACIFVPTISSPAKISAIQALGADLVVEGERYAEALALCEAYCARTGARSIHAYDQVATLLGQGTLGAEFEEQAAKLDAVLVAVGGGGLIGGVAGWYRGRVRVIGVEPDGAPSLHMALTAGRPVEAPQGSIAADSLAPRQVGGLMFPLAQAYVEGVTLVSDDDIRRAQALLWERLRIVAEPGGATALAALTGGHYRPKPGERVGVVVCGGNTSAVDFSG